MTCAEIICTLRLASRRERSAGSGRLPAAIILACLLRAASASPNDLEPSSAGVTQPANVRPFSLLTSTTFELTAPAERRDDKPAAETEKQQTPEIARRADVRRPWGILYYHSQMTDNSVWEVLESRGVEFKFGSLDSIDIEYELQHENPFRKFLQPLLGTIQLGAAATKHNDPGGGSFEIAPYVMFRWRHLPLERFLVVTIGVGEGVSYVTRVPTRELEGKGKNVLDFMALEATFALPSHPQLEIVPRIHHRSSAWSLFGDSVSSNALGVGVRYLFGR